MTRSSSLSTIRRRIPLFPFIPLAPLAFAISLFMLFRRVRMIEQRLL